MPKGGKELLQFALTQNLPCVIIISVKIEKAYTTGRTEQNRKGSGNF